MSLRVIDSSHASILPRVFNGVDKLDVLALDVKTSVLVNVVLDVWLSELLSEDSRAVRNPVIMSNSLGSHSILSLRNLEPSEFSAVLPSPLSHVVVDIVGNVLKRLSVVLAKEHSLSLSVLHENWQLLLRVSSGNAG